MNTTHEIELTRPVDLCDSQGNLNPSAAGWSRSPFHRCNLHGHPLRKKAWNYWCITTPTHLFSVTLSNVDYMGLAFIYYLDFATREFHEQTVMTALGSGFAMPDHVQDSVVFNHKEMLVEFVEKEGGIDLRVNAQNFAGMPLSANFRVTRPKDHQTLNVIIPWSKTRFQFTSKQECLPAEGKVQMGDREIDFAGRDCFACLDFGRGVWKYASSWNWGAFSGWSGDNCVGVNLGGKWTDGTGYTENGIVLNGRLIKIGEEIEFEYDPADFMKPWHIRTRQTDLLDLTFTPFFERVAKTEALILRSEVHQMIGHYAGTIRDEAGNVYPVSQIPGWAEEHHARW